MEGQRRFSLVDGEDGRGGQSQFYRRGQGQGTTMVCVMGDGRGGGGGLFNNRTLTMLAPAMQMKTSVWRGIAAETTSSEDTETCGDEFELAPLSTHRCKPLNRPPRIVHVQQTEAGKISGRILRAHL